jgi:RNA polymerase sigma-70 factor (ECF subfamily)
LRNKTVASEPSTQFVDEFTAHRPELLRHCYRLMGSFADAEDAVQDALAKAWKSMETYSGEVPVAHWLMRIATNTCLTALVHRRARGLPQLDRAPVATWVTPAPDARLFPTPDEAAETREDVAIAFIALLQRLPPRQRAVLLLKDVVGWPSEEIAAALDLSVSAVSSALHRARETVAARPRGRTADPPPEVLRDYVRSWEAHDLDGLVALLKKDIVFAMPPHEIWFQGAEAVRDFLQTPRFAAFWAAGLRAKSTRANGLPALGWYSPFRSPGEWRLHSVHVMRWDGGQLAEATNFIGSHYLHGFGLPETVVPRPPEGS